MDVDKSNTITIMDLIKAKEFLASQPVKERSVVVCHSIETWKMLAKYNQNFADWLEEGLENYNRDTGFIGSRNGIECYVDLLNSKL